MYIIKITRRVKKRFRAGVDLVKLYHSGYLQVGDTVMPTTSNSIAYAKEIDKAKADELAAFYRKQYPRNSVAILDLNR